MGHLAQDTSFTHPDLPNYKEIAQGDREITFPKHNRARSDELTFCLFRKKYIARVFQGKELTLLEHEQKK